MAWSAGMAAARMRLVWQTGTGLSVLGPKGVCHGCSYAAEHGDQDERQEAPDYDLSQVVVKKVLHDFLLRTFPRRADLHTACRSWSPLLPREMNNLVFYKVRPCSL